MATGYVKLFFERRGFGFIACEDGREAFVHRDNILGKCKQLRRGELVEFELVPVTRGWSARGVRRVQLASPHQPYEMRGEK